MAYLNPLLWKIVVVNKGGRKKKNGLFTVRLTVRGGSAPSALTVSKCENFNLF